MTTPATNPTTDIDPSEALFLWRVMEQFAFEYCDQLFWRIDDGKMSVFADCSDVFAWGCADVEPITEETLPALIAARRDAEALAATHFAHEWVYLYCARLRQMRPQGAAYKHIREELHELFDACGPQRDVGLGNPVAR